MTPYSCRKSQSERYDIRLQDQTSCWAIFTINERGGIFSVTSDHGNYAHNWPHHDRQSFKHFLIEIDTDYLLGKLVGRQTYVNVKRTLEEWVKQVAEDPDIDDKKRAFYNREIKRFSSSTGDDINTLFYELRSYPELENYLGIECPIVCGWDPQAAQFVARLWGPFIDVLKQEISGRFNEEVLALGVTGGEPKEAIK